MKLIDFIICDDVRQELFAKHTLVGVYDNELSFLVPNLQEDKWPKVIKLGFFVRLMLDQTKETPDEFKMEMFHDGKGIGTAAGRVEAAAGVTFLVFATVINQFKITGVGKLSFKLQTFRDSKLISEIVPPYTLTIKVTQAQQ